MNGYAEDLGGFFDAEAGEKTELDGTGLPRIERGERVERIIERDDFTVVRRCGEEGVVEGNAGGDAAALGAVAGTGGIDQHATHHLGGESEELVAVVEGEAGSVDQAQVDLVNESGGLEGNPGAFQRHPLLGKAAEFGVDQGNEAVQRVLIAASPGLQKLGNAGLGVFSRRHSTDLIKKVCEAWQIAPCRFRFWAAEGSGMTKSLVVATMMMAGAANGRPCVTMAVRGSQGVAPETMMNAEITAANIFRSAGIELRFGSHGGRECAAVTVELAWDAPKTAGTLAFAQPYATTTSKIHIYMARILNGPGRNDGVLLGHVMAHEIGHMLQGIDRHSADGVMKARWTSADYNAMRAKPLEFTSLDVKLMALGLEKRFGGV